MKRFLYFLKSTKWVSRILFLLWIVFSSFANFPNESRLQIVLEFGAFLLIPALLIEIFKNPALKKQQSDVAEEATMSFGAKIKKLLFPFRWVYALLIAMWVYGSFFSAFSKSDGILSGMVIYGIIFIAPIIVLEIVLYALMLYTEDTYEVENEPYFGYMRGRYTIAEMKEMDAYCCSIGIELIPCIQVLAHLGHIPRWEEYWSHMDSQDVLLVGDERNYRLIENMLATLSKCFTSRRIHIGMDEAFYLGTGRYLQQNGYRDRLQIFVEHLTRVKQLTDQYGMKPMMWSDMFFHLVGEDKKLPPEILRQVPEGVELVYWDYDAKEQKHYDENITAHKQFQNNKTAYAAAVWTCTGYAPNLRLSLDSADAAMRSVRENGIDTVLVTMWGDDGKDCSYFAGLSGLFAAAQMANGNFDRQDIAEKFQNLFGYRFEEFMNLELANITAEEESHRHNPSKYLLFNDPFLGLLDYTVHDELKARYFAAVKTVEASVNGRKYDYLFDFQAKLLTLLSRKCDLGLRLRKAYQAQDKQTLVNLLEEEFPPMEQETRNVYEAFRTLWDRENKSIGFELQEMRFGALMLRHESCARMLREYLEGARERIEELEAPMLPGHYGMEGKAESFNSYLQTISANSNAF